MMQTDRFALPMLEAGQAQKEITHNEAIAAIDALLHPAARSLSVAAPPADAAPGEMWIVPAAATGAWAGHGGEIAIAEIGGWRFAAPRPGMIAWIADLGVHARYDGGWTADAWPVRALAVGARRLFASDPVAVAAPSGGAVIDAEARGALAALLAALRGQGVIG